MYTIKENLIYNLEIKKSKFITLLYKIQSKEDVDNYLNEVKNLYPNATHYCYAYRLKNIQKFSDDNEPGGTAGLPMMDIILKKDLVNILCIVVRYFGGIKLGAGGLIRAYSNSIKDAIDNSILVELVDGYLINITTTYDNQKQLDYILKDYIIKKEFNEDIIYEIELPLNNINILDGLKYEILCKKLIEKR